MRVELLGLELHGFHGVLPEEREHGQRFLVDVRLEPLDELAGRSDDIRDAVDYRAVVAIVREISDVRAPSSCSRRSPLPWPTRCWHAFRWPGWR